MAAVPEVFSGVAGAIQLALAPVFMLTGIAGMLNVMAGRLARIIDRGRTLARSERSATLLENGSIDVELTYLERRRRYNSIAIAGCTISALLVCMVVAALFLEVMLSMPLDWLIGALFTASMLTLIVGLAYFLREVHLATKTIRIQMPTRSD